jgi:hypothetical protein
MIKGEKRKSKEGPQERKKLINKKESTFLL